MAERREVEFTDLPVTLLFCAGAIGVTAMEWFGKSIDKLTLIPETFWAEPWRLVTCALPHANILHLLFNVVWTFSFGRVIESRFGSLKTLALFVALAIGSAAGEYAFFRGGIGLSGIGYGLFGFLWIASKRSRELSGAITSQTVTTFIGWFFFCIAMTYFDVLPIANVAHGVGCALGAIAGAAATAKPGRALGWFAGLVATIAAMLALATVFRSRVNVSGMEHELARRALDILDEDPVRAADLLRDAIVRDPKEPNFWYNLGVAEARAGHSEKAAEAFAEACKLTPTSERYCIDVKTAKLAR